MHEHSVAVRLVTAAAAAAARTAPARITAVHVRVGELSGLSPEHLRDAFDRTVAGTALAGARLVVALGDGVGDLSPGADGVTLVSLEVTD